MAGWLEGEFAFSAQLIRLRRERVDIAAAMREKINSVMVRRAVRVPESKKEQRQ
jgi:hypothetical protein